MVKLAEVCIPHGNSKFIWDFGWRTSNFAFNTNRKFLGQIYVNHSYSALSLEALSSILNRRQAGIF